MRLPVTVAALILALTVIFPARADELFLKNGDHITGHILSMDEESLVVKTAYGELTIARSEVLSGSFNAVVETPDQGLDLEFLFDADVLLPDGSGAVLVDHDTLRGPGADGTTDSAMRSSGDGRYLEITDLPDLDSAKDVTLSFWILVKDASRLQYILSKWDIAEGARANGKFAVGTRYSSLYVYLVDPEGVYHFQSYEDVIPLSEWTHVAIVFEGGLLSVYKNGIGVGQSSLPFGELKMNSSPLYILTAKAATDNPWSYYNVNGSLDNLRIYSRALSVVEIEALSEEF